MMESATTFTQGEMVDINKLFGNSKRGLEKAKQSVARLDRRKLRKEKLKKLQAKFKS